MNILHRYTVRTLQKNKVRTLVTIIGIILSVAMITAVTTSVSSLLHYLMNVTIQSDGSWHGMYYGMSAEQYEELKALTEVNETVALQSEGYARIDSPVIERKPYLFIGAMSSGFSDTVPVKLTAGRMPQNSNELLLPESYFHSGAPSVKLDQQITLAVGSRCDEDGTALFQQNPYEEGETFLPGEARTYTVVGFYEGLKQDTYYSAGYTLLTVAKVEVGAMQNVFFKLHHMEETYSFMESKRFDTLYGKANEDLLMYNGHINEPSLALTLGGMAAIIGAIIFFSSVSLIYNAFSISVSERTKQFGLLSSVGATRKQLLRSVLFEGSALSLIGIPLGVGAGILGMWITFMCTSDMFSAVFGSGTGTAFSLHVSWLSVVLAAVLGFLTILVSAYIPARRAARVSAIEAIRQSKDVNIKAREIKTSRLTQRLFGFEGTLAAKNFKRSRKKYRATVFSLFISIVLFISASSFCSYVTAGAADIVSRPEYDLIYRFNEAENDPEQLLAMLSAAEHVTDAQYYYETYVQMPVGTSALEPAYVDYVCRTWDIGKDSVKAIPLNVRMCFLNDEAYQEYAKQMLAEIPSGGEFLPPAIVLNDFTYKHNGKYVATGILKENTSAFDLYMVRKLEGMAFDYEVWNEEKNMMEYRYTLLGADEENSRRSFYAEEATDRRQVQIALVTKKGPFSVANRGNDGITMIFPYSAVSVLNGYEHRNSYRTMGFRADHHKAAYNELTTILLRNGLSTGDLYDYAETVESRRAMVVVVNVFAYGFITLVSLIALANVFNTISTNVHLRRREFAMLKSIGMTKRGFNKMMNFECLLYGIKGLVYGLPVAFGMSYLMYLTVNESWNSGFRVPWQSVCIAVGSVFAVVFAAMLYSMHKIKKDNPIDAMKNENL